MLATEVDGTRGVAMENISGRPRFSGGSLPLDRGLVVGSTGSTTGLGPGGLLDRKTLSRPGGGGGGGPPDDAAIDTSVGFLLRAAASCALEIANFSVNIPTSTPVCLAASMS